MLHSVPAAASADRSVRQMRFQPRTVTETGEDTGMNRNIILCGVGGQGTILASRLIAAAAMAGGFPIRTAETIGMAQRGGSVFSHIRIGEGCASPLIARGEADLIIGFEPGEAVRQLPYLKKGGTVVTSMRPVIPVSAMMGQFPYDPEACLEYLKQHYNLSYNEDKYIVFYEPMASNLMPSIKVAERGAMDL